MKALTLSTINNYYKNAKIAETGGITTNFPPLEAATSAGSAAQATSLPARPQPSVVSHAAPAPSVAPAKKEGPPPLRHGRWTPEEEAYANRLIQEFKAGLLPLADGTTLRIFLSKLLNCDPMRISKKFVGENFIGKQVFCRRTADINRLTPQQIQQSRAELSELERCFLERVTQTRKRAGYAKPFPEKLHEMLAEESDSLDVLGWLPHGRAFIVRKPKDFMERIMGKYFRQTKLTSFQRQLLLYGFRRITQGPDAGAYYHELFLKGRPKLCLRMQRQKVKGTGHKLPSDAETEPNFYTMPSSINPDTRNTTAQAQESPGMQGLRGASNLLQGISAGLPPAALLSKSIGHQPPHGFSLFYSTASSAIPQHWQYASVVARHESLVKQKAAQAKDEKITSTQTNKDEKEDRKKPPLDRSQGAQATDGKP